MYRRTKPGFKGWLAGFCYRLSYTLDQEGHKKPRDELKAAMWELRDQIHNLPAHLNLPKEESCFLHSLYASLADMFGAKLHNDTRMKFLCADSVWDCSARTMALRQRYTGCPPLHSGEPLTKNDFDKAVEGDLVANLYIAKVILGENFDRYQRVDVWHRRMD